jgi:hypothetical protein
MDKIDELERRIEELKQEKRIAELELQVAHLLDEIAALKWRPAYWTPCPDWTWRPQYGPTYYTTSGESTSDTYVAKQ